MEAPEQEWLEEQFQEGDLEEQEWPEVGAHVSENTENLVILPLVLLLLLSY